MVDVLIIGVIFLARELMLGCLKSQVDRVWSLTRNLVPLWLRHISTFIEPTLSNHSSLERKELWDYWVILQINECVLLTYPREYVELLNRLCRNLRLGVQWFLLLDYPWQSLDDRWKLSMIQRTTAGVYEGHSMITATLSTGRDAAVVEAMMEHAGWSMWLPSLNIIVASRRAVE